MNTSTTSTLSVFVETFTTSDIHHTTFPALTDHRRLHTPNGCQTPAKALEAVTLTGQQLADTNLTPCYLCARHDVAGPTATLECLLNIKQATQQLTSHLRQTNQQLQLRANQPPIQQVPLAALRPFHDHLSFLRRAANSTQRHPTVVHLAQQLHDQLQPHTERLLDQWHTATDHTLWMAAPALRQNHVKDSLRTIVYDNLHNTAGLADSAATTALHAYRLARTSVTGMHSTADVLHQRAPGVTRRVNLDQLISELDQHLVDQADHAWNQPHHVVAVLAPHSQKDSGRGNQPLIDELLRQHGHGMHMRAVHLLEVAPLHATQPNTDTHRTRLDLGPAHQLTYTPEGLQTADQLAGGALTADTQETIRNLQQLLQATTTATS